MTVTLPYAVQHDVASTVAKGWIGRGVKSYAYEDMYQDAVEVMHQVMHRSVCRYNPAKGTLAGYLHRACVRQLQDRITRAIQPVGTRSNGEVKALREVQRVGLTPALQEARLRSAEDCDTVVLRSQIRRRLIAVAETVPEGQTALAILTGATSVGELSQGDATRAQRLYYCVRRMKKAIREDLALAEMHGDT